MNEACFSVLTENESLEIEGGDLVKDIGRIVGKGVYYFCKFADKLTTAGEMDRWNKYN